MYQVLTFLIFVLAICTTSISNQLLRDLCTTVGHIFKRDGSGILGVHVLVCTEVVGDFECVILLSMARYQATVAIVLISRMLSTQLQAHGM